RELIGGRRGGLRMRERSESDQRRTHECDAPWAQWHAAGSICQTSRMIPRWAASLARVLCACTMLGALACGSDSNTSPTPPPSTPPRVTTVSVIGSATSLPVGSKSSLKATAAMSDGSTQDVTAQATWESSNAAVASVAAGEVTAVTPGEADIRA